MNDDQPNTERVDDRSEARKRERAERTESILADVERDLGDVEYPTTSEELAIEYGTEQIDLPNETESLGSVFDRLAGEEFDSATEAREAIYGEITGEAGEITEANPERDLETLDRDAQDSLTDSGSDHQ